VRHALLYLVFSVCLSAQTASPLLTYSSYLRVGFTPFALASDPTGNLYLAGVVANAGLLVEKLNPQASGYVYTSFINAGSPRAAAVDGSGNLWITGQYTTPADPSDPRSVPQSQSFLTKVDASGNALFTRFFGATAQSYGLALAVTPKGEVLVSGIASAGGFPATPGAYHVPDSTQRPYLVKFDASGNVLFSATGVGGSSIVLDGAGNIFVSGNTSQTDYPTTPGAYQTQFVPTLLCTNISPLGFCFASTNQYLTKLDPNASQLLYSTGINGMDSLTTINTGLAVDASGNAYVTGSTLSTKYPFTTPPVPGSTAVPFVTKLGPDGKSVIWSVPQGGSGLQYDAASGSLDVIGQLSTPWISGLIPSSTSPPPPPGLNTIPTPCLTNNLTSITESYAARVDSATGQTSSAMLISGSRVALSGTALAGNGLFWFMGPSAQPDVPFTANALFPLGMTPGPADGAYLGAIDFSQTSTTAPALSCVLDAADQAPIGLVAPNQLLALLGANLGPPVGVQAPDGGGATSLGGVSVTFDGTPAQLLFASESQINLAVPFGVGSQHSTVMQVTVNGVPSPPRLFPVTTSNPALFTTATFAPLGCNGVAVPMGSVAVTSPTVRNADGTLNSCNAPAKPGSVISFFVNGVGWGSPYPSNPPLPRSVGFEVAIGAWSAEIANVVKDSDFVWRVDVRLPEGFVGSSTSAVLVTMREGELLVGPLQLFYQGQQAAQMPELSALVWVSQ